MAEKDKPGKIVVIRIRGEIDVRKTIKDTLTMLGLRHANWATLVDDTPAYKGMINKVKDFVTWGEIDEKHLTMLLEKWGRKAGDKRLESSEAKKIAGDLISGKTTFKKAELKPYFRLHPPTKGHSREGIKKHVNVGGSLGYRGKDINMLLEKMAGLKLSKSKDGS
jgi:large subunit ribosomal protein L30